MAASTGTVVVGAHMAVLINGRRFGEATRLEHGSDTPVDEKRGLDSMVAFELAPTTAIVTGTLMMLRVRGTGALEGLGITAPFRKIPMGKYFSILVVNRLDGSKVFAADRCLVTNQRWIFGAKERASGTFSFKGIEFSNEATDAYG